MHVNLHLVVEADYTGACRKAARLISRALRKKPEGVFGFATGETVKGLYKALARQSREEAPDFSKITAFVLDELHPITADDIRSHSRFMHEHLFHPMLVDPERIFTPDGEAADTERERACLIYERQIEAVGGIDALVLGIGANGHIGFNEPGSAFAAGTHLVSLTEMTRESISRRFGDRAEAPRYALTMGIRTIMLARHILLLCSGANKAAILRDALTGPITPLVPASALQLHPSVTVVADREAAQLLV